MRKVTFYIDDLEWFRKVYNLTDKQMEDLFSDTNTNGFKVIYILYGDGNDVDRYTLTDYDGNKIDINTLNGFQRSVILGDCWAYFTSGNYSDNDKEPCGVIRIEEDVVEGC